MNGLTPYLLFVPVRVIVRWRTSPGCAEVLSSESLSVVPPPSHWKDGVVSV